MADIRSQLHDAAARERVPLDMDASLRAAAAMRVRRSIAIALGGLSVLLLGVFVGPSIYERITGKEAPPAPVDQPDRRVRQARIPNKPEDVFEHAPEYDFRRSGPHAKDLLKSLKRNLYELTGQRATSGIVRHPTHRRPPPPVDVVVLSFEVPRSDIESFRNEALEGLERRARREGARVSRILGGRAVRVRVVGDSEAADLRFQAVYFFVGNENQLFVEVLGRRPANIVAIAEALFEANGGEGRT